MAQPRQHTDKQRYCAYCGRELESARDVVDRFGERFCSEEHAANFAAGTQEARGKTLKNGAQRSRWPVSRGASSTRPSHWVLSILVLIILGAALLWGGGWGSLGFGSGTSLLVLALILLICPLGMYFMMRGGMRDMDDRKHEPPDREPRNRA